MRFRGPLANSYPAAVALVVFALTPYLGLTGALTPLTPILTKSLGLSPQAFQLTTGMANAGYAFGTVLAVQFATHLRGRRMLVLYATGFVIGSVMAAWAPNPGFFIAGHVLQGMTTSLMLIAAVPPLVIGWPTSKMPITGIVMNMCVFGAVAIGPVVGGVQAGAHAWRPLFWLVAGLGGLALLFALLTFEDQEPQDPSAPWDWVALVLAGGGCAAAFFGASELATHPMMSAIVFIPLVGGAAMIVALVVYEYVIKRPLMPVRKVTTTFPVAGIIIAMSAGAASVAAIQLTATALQKHGSPTHIAMLFWPEFGGAVATALLFGALFRTRFTPLLALTGTILLAGGAAVLSGVATGPHVLVVVGSGLVGLGVGASVSPALFISGFSLASAQIQRVFALIELLRGVAAFMVAPILLHLATTVARSPTQGIPTAMWVCFGLAAGGGAAGAFVLVLGGARLQRPDLDRWENGEEPAWESPPLAARLRGDRTEPAMASLSGSPVPDGFGDRAQRSRSRAR
ncbi:MAG TPA: MFS transporter [Solirubrobacteraceae bacterium]|jgi:MFS family permease|nr:MFS transporter [Solirubrobacteraceae bacterium]